MMRIDPDLFAKMVEHGLREFPNEACGLLAGTERVAARFFPMRNIEASPATYRLDSQELLGVMNEIDDDGQELIGIFHTHTHSEAYPSETDTKLAFYPDATYLVMSLSDRDRPDLRGFRIVDGEIVEEELTIG
jgi:proteasome lid subunit RPN8/RPN11